MQWREEEADTWQLKLDLLGALREKDFWDLQPEVIQSHLGAVRGFANQPGVPKDIFVEYILNPRIDREMLSAYAAFIQQFFSEEQKQAFVAQPQKVCEYVSQNIETHQEKEYSTLVTSPEGCLKSGVGSIWSKAVLCVAIYRALGIAARINPMDKNVEIYQNGSFVSMQEKADTRETVDNRTSVITIHPDGVNNWKYFQSWSLSRMKNGVFVPFDLEEDENPHRALRAEAGIYRLLTINRLPNGNVFARKFDFALKDNEEREITLSLREAKLSEMLPQNAILDFELKDEQGNAVAMSGLEDGRRKVLFWLEESREPTEHVLNELYAQAEKFKKFEKDLYFIIRNKEVLQDPTLKHTLEALPNVHFLYDDFGVNVQTLARRMYVDPDKLPLIVIIQPGLKGVYAASGYNVGTADMLLRILTLPYL